MHAWDKNHEWNELRTDKRLLPGQHILPPLLEHLRVSRRISNGSCDFGAFFRYEVGFPSLNGFRCLAVRWAVKDQRPWTKRNKRERTNLGAYVRAKRAASGARWVLTRRSTHAAASASWSVIAKARLFCPFSTNKRNPKRETVRETEKKEYAANK